MIKILQQITIEKDTLIFTENPEKDIVEVIKQYEDDEREGYMGYEEPSLVDFNFLGTDYKAISFWHDNKDPEEIKIK